MPVPLILAVDGGQASTVALLAQPDGALLGAGLGGPANHVGEAGGIERMRASLRRAITGAFDAAGLPLGPVSSACFGMTGGMEFVPIAAAAIVPCKLLRVEHDVVTALAGASGGEPGVVVIAGSGAIAYGRNAAGNTARASGWGYLVGDEGSGYSIGIHAIRAACRAEDGRGRPTLLADLLLHHFAVPDLWTLRTDLYAQRYTRSDLARVARLVSEAAEQGDDEALGILANAGEELALAALAVLARLQLLRQEPAVYFAGGVFHAGEAVLRPFRDTIWRCAPRARILAPLFNQVVGALLLALEAYGVQLGPEVLGRIRCNLDLVTKVKES